MARTPQWIKKLGGHAGELFVAAELSKRAIPNALLPENFSDDDILIGNKDGTEIGFVQVKACHPDRSNSFILRETQESWITASPNSFCVFVWLGRTATNDPPTFWIATKAEVGRACVEHPADKATNWERRFFRPGGNVSAAACLREEWHARWTVFDRFRPIGPSALAGLSDEQVGT